MKFDFLNRNKRWGRMATIRIILFFAATIIFVTYLGSRVNAGGDYTWDGEGADNNFSTCANWTGDICPALSDDNLYFDGTSTKDAVIDAGFQGTLNFINIGSGYTGVITQNRSLTLSYMLQIYGGTFNAGSQDLSMRYLSLNDGVFTASSGTTTISGNFDRVAGTFNHNNGTILFDSDRDTGIYGSSTFFNVTKSSAGGASMIFYGGTTQTILGTLTLTGTGAGQRLFIRSNVTNTQGNIDPQGPRNISYVDVQDSNNTNVTPITATADSIDRGNNTNWLNLTPASGTPVMTETPPQYLLKFGDELKGNQFRTPYGMATDSDGNVYVGDSGFNTIRKFNSSGDFVMQWGGGGSGNGQFNGVYALAVDGDNNVYVADRYNYRIQKFSSNGTFITKWGSNGTGDGEFNYPMAIASDSSNNIYVTEYDNHRVQKFTSSGVFVTKWGEVGDLDGQFNYPTAITVDGDDNVYVGDDHMWIQKFSSTGVFISKWGTPGTGNGEFYNMSSLAVDGSNNIYQVDNGLSRVQKFTSTGVYTTQWGTSGTGNGEFDYPQAASVTGSYIYITDSNNARVQKFDLNGIYNSQFGEADHIDAGQFGVPIDLAVSPSGDVFVVDNGNDRIAQFSSTGEFISQFGSNGSGNGQFSNPSGIAIDSSGNIYVSDNGNYRIQKFNSAGVFVTKWGESGSGDGQFNNPQGMIIDADGNIYVVDSSNYRVQKFTSSGTYLSQFGHQGTSYGNFNYANDIDIDSQGNLYVVNYNQARIQKFDSSGNFLQAIGSPVSGGENGQASGSYSLAIDNEDNIYLADNGNHRIQKLASDGTFKTKWGESGSANGQFNQPRGLTIDAYGNIYVADPGNYRVQKFGKLQVLTAGYSSADQAVSPSSPGTLDEFGGSYTQDGAYWITSLSTVDGGYDSQVFKLHPTNLSNISQPNFNIAWHGHGESAADKKVSVSVWNIITSKWEQVESQHCADDCTIVVGRSGTQYRDSNNDVWVWVKADNSYTPPLTISSVSSNSNLLPISWTTNIVSTSQVFWDTTSHASGTINDYPNHTVEDTTLSLTHTVLPTIGTGTYYYRVRSGTVGGDYTVSDEFSLTYVFTSSCPFIFTYDGTSYNFVTDVASAASLGRGLRKEQWAATPFYRDPSTVYPLPESYTGVEGSKLSPRTEGDQTYYDIRATTELNEVNYFDDASLIVVDHSTAVNAYPDYRNNGVIHTVSKSAAAPVWAKDQSGADVTEQIAQNDNVYWHGSQSVSPSYVTVKLLNEATTSAHLKLLIKRAKDGDVSGTSKDTLLIKNDADQFVEVPSDKNPFMVTRNGAPKSASNLVNTYGSETKVIDLSGLTIKDSEVRIQTDTTTRRWLIDHLAVDTSDDEEVHTETLNPYFADLHQRGVSKQVKTNPSDNTMNVTQPDYAQLVKTRGEGNALTGSATKFGDVAPLLESVDDKFVVMVQGDEIALRYHVPAQAVGTERNFIFSAWDYHKSYRNALGDTISPLPFNEMTRYPYKDSEESYPSALQEILNMYNTRVIDWGDAVSTEPVDFTHRSANTDYITITATEGATGSATGPAPDGNRSTTDAPKCTTEPAPAPDIFQVDRSYRSATVHFTPLSDSVSSYTISYGTDENAEGYSIELPITHSDGAITETINELSAGGSYYFKVRAQKGCMPGTWSKPLKDSLARSWYSFSATTTTKDPAPLTAIGPDSGTSLRQENVAPQVRNSTTQNIPQQKPSATSTVSTQSSSSWFDRIVQWVKGLVGK